jgi:transcriptional regulator with XRE-family HTH domain
MIDVKRFRKENNLSQKEISGLLGMKQSYLSAVEAGKRPLSEEKFKILFNRFGDIVLKYKRPDVVIEVKPEEPKTPDPTPATTTSEFFAYLKEKDRIIEQKEKEIRELLKLVNTLEAKLDMLKNR